MVAFFAAAFFATCLGAQADLKFEKTMIELHPKSSDADAVANFSYVNTGKTTMRYLALSTLVEVETCEYPDSQKILIVAGPRGERGVRKMFRAENTVDYYDRESTEERR